MEDRGEESGRREALKEEMEENLLANVEIYVEMSTSVLQHNFEILVLNCFHFMLLYISTPLTFREKYHNFDSTTFIRQLQLLFTFRIKILSNKYTL